MGKRYDAGEECSGTSLSPASPIVWRNHVMDRGTCPVCGKQKIALTTAGNIRSHKPKSS